jgi:hypothetical protein
MNLPPADWKSVTAVIELHAQKQSAFIKQVIREHNRSLMAEENSIASLQEKRSDVERAVSQYKQIQKRLEQVRILMQTSSQR